LFSFDLGNYSKENSFTDTTQENEDYDFFNELNLNISQSKIKLSANFFKKPETTPRYSTVLSRKERQTF
jgi:hypothetical protein